MATGPAGINDGGWITGSYTDSSGYFHGFLYKNGSFFPFDYPGGFFTVGNAIDGLGRITGNCCSDQDCANAAPGFVDNAGSFAPSMGTFNSFSYPGADAATIPYGINNNGQISGQDYDYSGSLNSYNFLLDYSFGPSGPSIRWCRRLL